MSEAKIKNDYAEYVARLTRHLWSYQQSHFPRWEEYLEKPEDATGRPPVFLKEKADWNVLFKPGESEERRSRILQEIPDTERHRWFRSMKSSQAIAQTVFGTLKVYGALKDLAEMHDETGLPLFGDAEVTPENCTMEYHVDYLGEPRSTSVDLFISGNYRVAIECKLTEEKVGPCSRPGLLPKDSNYERHYCDGTYTRQRGREARCTLTEIGVHYWDYIPQLFHWDADRDHSPCPVRINYQLVRNILAATVRSDQGVVADRGHVLLVYDERNQEFREGGAGFQAFAETGQALHNPDLLRRCSWQRIMAYLRSNGRMAWLADLAKAKYGI